MFKIEVSEQIRQACPDFKGVEILCDVKNVSCNEALWTLIEQEVDILKTSLSLETIKLNSVINATRATYKKLGKDPNRYRPSSEALCRRIVRGLPLYQVSSLVDLINLISLKTGYCIGGFDADKIEGNLRLGVGIADEPFEAIGRGKMNIEGLPVYRDSIGGIGNPSSDEERTKIALETVHLLMLINGYSGKEGLNEATDYSIDLLKKYAYAEQIKIRSVNGEISKSN